MLLRTVRKDGTGDYRTLTEAVQSIPYEEPATIRVGAGEFVEKLFVEKRNLRILGSGMDSTVLRWADGALHPHPDGTPTGTFRSYTAFLGGERIEVRDMTIANSAGDGETHGQAIAVYADAARVFMQNVALVSKQDTLFCAPLPERERLPRGFYGPRALNPRLSTRQLYRQCRIVGDVDFIFGGADAVFDRCMLVSLDRGQTVNGFVTAPSGLAEGLGFAFLDCAFTGPCAAGTVYLGRPWREEGRAVLWRCALGPHIHPQGWAAWPGAGSEEKSFFAEVESRGSGARDEERVNWAHRLSEVETERWLTRVWALMAEVEGTLQSNHGTDNE
ncbi:MAG: pectinesterase family protein [Candidatus Limiplasma sp.]|nr:pectinesterase family protein [Candidatus Limiplasma sp.]